MIVFFRNIWELARPYRWRLFFGMLMGILSGLIYPLMLVAIKLLSVVLFPSTDPVNSTLPVKKLPHYFQFLQPMVDGVHTWIDGAQASLSHGLETNRLEFLGFIALIPILSLLRGLTGYFNVYFLEWAGSRAVADLRTKLFTHLMDLSAGFYTENATGKLISRVMSDTQALQTIITNVVSVVVRDPVALIGTFSYLLCTQPKLTLLSITILPVCIIPIAIYGRKVRRVSRDSQSKTADLIQTMTESFTGYRVIKAYNLESMVAEKFRQAARHSVSLIMRIIRASEMPGVLIEFFGSCGVAIMLAYIYLVAKDRPSPGDFSTLLAAIFLIYAPLKNLTRLQNQIIQAHAATDRVFEMLATKNSVPEPAQPKILHAANAPIRFENVSFKYGEKTVLHNINLDVQPGQLVAFVGKTGSGKTTMANLLLRFYDPAGGAIKIGGVDIREFSTRDLRNQMAVVSQENILFNDTIRRNIELGRLGATEEEIVAAARFAKADEFIAQKPDGFDTVIGEKGIMLSGGQRQRLAIARAVLRDAPILILDEATSALDTEVERQVQAEFDKLMEGRTTFCIAHRLSTIMHADLIVVLEQGNIVETGTHDELLKHGGIYQKLHGLQFNS